MAEQFERLARPSSVLENPGVVPARGMNRGKLTVVLSLIGLLAGAAAAGVTYWKWNSAEQQMTLNQAGTLQLDARANAILEEYNANPNSHPQLKVEFQKLHADLTYQPPAGALGIYEELAFSAFAQRSMALALERRKLFAEKIQADGSTQDHLAAVRNHNQDVAKKAQETRTAAKQADMTEGIITPPVINALARAARGAAIGDPNLLNIPGYDPRHDIVGVPPIAKGLPYSRSRGNSLRQADDPLANRSNLGNGPTVWEVDK